MCTVPQTLSCGCKKGLGTTRLVYNYNSGLIIIQAGVAPFAHPCPAAPDLIIYHHHDTYVHAIQYHE